MNGRLASVALLIAVALSFPFIIGAASAQSRGYMEVMSMLFNRIHPADKEMVERLNQRVELKTATKDEVVKLYARAYAYYEQRDFFTARSLFIAGGGARAALGWPSDEIDARASFFRVMSDLNFCAQEARNCEIYYSVQSTHPQLFLLEELELTMGLMDGAAYVPADLAPKIAKERHEMRRRFCQLLKANPAYVPLRKDLVSICK